MQGQLTHSQSWFDSLRNYSFDQFMKTKVFLGFLVQAIPHKEAKKIGWTLKTGPEIKKIQFKHSIGLGALKIISWATIVCLHFS